MFFEMPLEGMPVMVNTPSVELQSSHPPGVVQLSLESVDSLYALKVQPVPEALRASVRGNRDDRLRIQAERSSGAVFQTLSLPAFRGHDGGGLPRLGEIASLDRG